jgi:type 2 lantibiotic biosynthesis protein LanM
MYLKLLGQAKGDFPDSHSPALSLHENIRNPWLLALRSQDFESLDRRLKWDNLNPTRLNLLLKNRGEFSLDQFLEPVANTIEPLWLSGLKEIRSALRTAQNEALEVNEKFQNLMGDSQLPFYHLWDPAVDLATSLLRQKFADLIGTSFDERIFNRLGYQLLSRLCYVSGNVLWDLFKAELGQGALFLSYINKKRDCSKHPRSDRYQKFILEHRSDGLEKILFLFPVLGSIIGNVWVFWLDSSIEMLSRVRMDRDILNETFDIPSNDLLVEIHQGLSDHHCSGRTVAILEFGDSHKVVYKPRDLNIDAAYQKVLSFCSNNIDLPPLRTLKILNCDKYGYMEYVKHKICKDENELIQFYYNAGRLSAILYVLGCTDCHHENLIAHGNQLLLIDTETLLEPTFANRIDSEPDPDLLDSLSSLTKCYLDSVFRVGLLPSWTVLSDKSYVVDLSALGIKPPTDEHEFIPGWLHLNSDEMMRGLLKVPSSLPTSLPVGSGSQNPLKPHMKYFMKGFKDQSLNLIEKRSEWLNPGGFYDLFVGLSRRIVLRATRIYFTIQLQQLQPDALRSDFAQGLKLEQLARFFVMEEKKPKSWPVLFAEILQLEQLDIPYFVHYVDSCKLPSQSGLDAIDDFFETSGLQDSRERLRTFDENGLEFQLHLIQGSIEAKEATCHGIQSLGGEKRQLNTKLELSVQNRVNISQLIAKELLVGSLQNKSEWLGFDLARDCQKFLFKPLGMSLYSGVPGIIVFLSCLLKSETFLNISPITEGLQEFVQVGLMTFVNSVECQTQGSLMRWWRDQPIGLGGCAGQLLSLIALDKVGVVPNGFKSNRDLADKLLEGASETHLFQLSSLDLISDSTGLIGPLLKLNTPKSIHISKLLGDKMIQFMGDLGEWIFSNPNPTTFGFSHGLPGLVATLAQLYTHTGILRYRDCALDGLAYEREHSMKEMSSLLNQYSSGALANNQLISSWCHGLTGSIIAKVCLMDTDLWQTSFEDDICQMADIIGRYAFTTDNICCGAFGSIAALRLAHERLCNDDLRVISDKIEIHCLPDTLKKNSSFLLNNPLPWKPLHSGFMNGLSGIGVALLDNVYSRQILRIIMSAGLMKT